ncbi:MAG: hypothetical protein AAFR33_09420 [Pseudomonadota bacterium]
MATHKAFLGWLDHVPNFVRQHEQREGAGALPIDENSTEQQAERTGHVHLNGLRVQQLLRPLPGHSSAIFGQVDWFYVASL